MTRKRLHLCLTFWMSLVAAFLFAGGTRAANPNLPELAAKANPSVVLLTIADAGGHKLGTGTGFFVSAAGRIVTNHHVVAGAGKVTATLSDGRKVEAEGLLASDEDRDLAIIKIPGEGYPALILGESRTLRMGDEIVVIGSPMGLSGTLSTGVVSAIRDEHALPDVKEEDGKFGSWRIQVTAAISPGSSGSPIMSPTGQVVAIAVGQHVGGQGLNFGIPVEEAKALLEKVDLGAKLERFSGAGGMSEVRKNLLISAAFFLVALLLYVGFKRSHWL